MLGTISKIASVTALVTTSLFLSSCGEQKLADDVLIDQKFDIVTKINGETFGTYYYITVPGGYPGGEDTLRSDAEFVFKHVSDAISTFDPNAELARFNEFKKTTPFPISEYLASLLEEVFRQGLRIDGKMDPTVGPLVNLWGFGPDGAVTKSPTQDQIDKVKKLVGPTKVMIRYTDNQPFLVKEDPDVKLDLSTVGEGLAADEIAYMLDERGINNYMIAIAGAIRSKGANPEGKLWRVGIEDPLSQGQAVFVPVCPQDMAISTAGSYRNFFLDTVSDHFYSHIIDPNTGRPIEHRTVSVTVVDNSALVTDALDTGLLVMGAKNAVDWGNKNNVAVYAIEVDKKGKAIPSYSKAFEPYLKCVVKAGAREILQKSMEASSQAK